MAICTIPLQNTQKVGIYESQKRAIYELRVTPPIPRFEESYGNLSLALENQQ